MARSSEAAAARPLLWNEHKAILWDEASPTLVAENRKVFQHPACWVDMGHSPTGQHLFRVFLNDACSIIATNSWESQLEEMSEEDRDWLAANVVMFKVTRPLWEGPHLEETPAAIELLTPDISDFQDVD